MRVERFILPALAVTAAGLAVGAALILGHPVLRRPARLLMANAVLGCALGIVIGFGWAEWLDRGLHR